MHTTQERRPRRRSIQRLQLALTFGLFLLIPIIAIAHKYRGAEIFWDAHTYLRAIHTFMAGGDPYAPASYFNFVYPPIFLRVAVPLSHLFPSHSGWYLYLALNCAAVLFIPIILARFYLRSPWLTPLVALGIFLFNPILTAEIALLSGNISNLFYAVILSAGVPGLRRNRWLLFYVAVACASVIKLPFLALLLLPLFLGHRQTIFSILTAAAVFLEIFFENLLLPMQYKAFLNSVVEQVVIRRDVGFGLFPHLLRISHHLPVLHERFAYILHIALTLALILALWVLRKSREGTLPEGVWIAAILITAILVTPRMLTYDADIAILPATLIVVETVRTLLHRRISPLLIALPIATFAFLLTWKPRAAILLFILCAILSVLAGTPTRSRQPQTAID